MTEVEEFIKRAEDRAKERKAGRSFEAVGTIVPTPEREPLIMALPALTTTRTDLQNPTTGQPGFMLGIDALGDPDRPLGGG